MKTIQAKAQTRAVTGSPPGCRETMPARVIPERLNAIQGMALQAARREEKRNSQMMPVQARTRSRIATTASKPETKALTAQLEPCVRPSFSDPGTSPGARRGPVPESVARHRAGGATRADSLQPDGSAFRPAQQSPPRS